MFQQLFVDCMREGKDGGLCVILKLNQVENKGTDVQVIREACV